METTPTTTSVKSNGDSVREAWYKIHDDAHSRYLPRVIGLTLNPDNPNIKVREIRQCCHDRKVLLRQLGHDYPEQVEEDITLCDQAAHDLERKRLYAEPPKDINNNNGRRNGNGTPDTKAEATIETPLDAKQRLAPASRIGSLVQGNRLWIAGVTAAALVAAVGIGIGRKSADADRREAAGTSAPADPQPEKAASGVPPPVSRQEAPVPAPRSPVIPPVAAAGPDLPVTDETAEVPQMEAILPTPAEKTVPVAVAMGPSPDPDPETPDSATVSDPRNLPAVENLAGSGADRALREKAESLRRLARSPEADIALVTQECREYIGELCRLGRFTEARAFHMGFATDTSKNSRVNRRDLAYASQLIARLKKSYEDGGIAYMEEALRRNPGDAAAAQAVAKYRCFDMGDWSQITPLLTADDPQVRDIARRVAIVPSMDANDLLALARDLIDGQSPPRPGMLAKAVECCERAGAKSGDPLSAQRAKTFLAHLVKTHGDVLQYIRATDVPETGGRPTDLLAGTPEEIKQRLHIARQNWDAVRAADGSTDLLGHSPYCEWAACARLELCDNHLETLRGGSYVIRATFSLTTPTPPPQGYPPDKAALAVPGMFGMIIPLPNGQSVPVAFDANAHRSFRQQGLYRAGYHVQPDLYARPAPPWCMDYSAPVLRNGEKDAQGRDQQYVIQVAVRTGPQGYAIETQIFYAGTDAPLCPPLRLAAPLNIRGDNYLLVGDNGTDGATDHLSVGFPVAGRRAVVSDVTIAPLSQRSK